MKNIQLPFKEMKIIEPNIKFGLKIGWKIPQERRDWDDDVQTLLTVLSALEKKSKLPKNAKDINKAMAQSYKNNQVGYDTHGKIQTSLVLDIEKVITQLI